MVPLSWRLSAPKMALAWSALMSAMFWVVVAAGASLVVGTVQARRARAALVHGSLWRSGTRDQVRRRVDDLAAHGVTEIVFQPCGPDTRAELERFREAVSA